MKRGTPNYNIRLYVCSTCNRPYLSQGALNSHNKRGHTNSHKPDLPHHDIVQAAINSKVSTHNRRLQTKDHNLGEDDIIIKEAIEDPSAVLYGFEEVFNLLRGYTSIKYNEHPLYYELCKVRTSSNINNSTNYTQEEAECIVAPSIMEYNKGIDKVFATYLKEQSQALNKEEYRKVLSLVLLYRECLIELSNKLKVKDLMNAAPRIANEVVTACVAQYEIGLSEGEAIKLAGDFCSWLLKHRHTTYKVNAIL
eukprot:TRINITY_DN7271_c0_g1_i4.p1 TRINITY_DN7271_c0_g1~~TRINITY_DN7271_c0_g1_i4.p1  ORF type:complete len:252 (+),score=-0.81 TRINITY_DN7271_c0_g1_i4:110-865(+)